MTTTSTTRWSSELAVWLAVDVAVATAFWIGSGPVAGLVSGAISLLLTAAVHFGRRRLDALRIASGVGDERNRELYVRASAATGTLLWAVITVWWLATVVAGEQNLTLLVLVLVYAAGFLGSSLYYARRG